MLLRKKTITVSNATGPGIEVVMVAFKQQLQLNTAYFLIQNIDFEPGAIEFKVKL